MGIRLDDNLSFAPMTDEIREKCRSRLDIIRILSKKSWGLDNKTLSALYKSLVGSIIDYVFPCLNLISEANTNKIQTIQNAAVRAILKLKYDTPSNLLHHEALEKLKLHTVANRLDELTERYVRGGLIYSVPLVVRLVDEYKRGFNSRYVSYPTPLCNCYLVYDEYVL